MTPGISRGEPRCAFFATLRASSSYLSHVINTLRRKRAFAPMRLMQVTVTLLVFLVWAPGAQAAREAIASAHPLATQAGMQILEKGGNAFDAAVAVAAALAVVEPYASGLGGGGFFLLHRDADRLDVMIDARETAPAAADPAFFLDSDGKAREKASVVGMRAAAIPGLPAGIARLAERYGTLPLSVTLAPAIALAREGFATDERFAFVVGLRKAMLQENRELANVFLDHGQPPAPGFKIKQPQLARTLQLLAAHGKAGFYSGENAEQMVAAVQAGGGAWQLTDLQRYTVVERPVQQFSYRGAKITCASLPSAGGLTLAQALQILERYPLRDLDAVERTHLVAEALRRGFQDRARYLGDPDFIEVPGWLGTRAYADRRAASIDIRHATSSEALAAINEGDNTSHFSLVDRAGNRVAATLSINLPFGAGVMAGDSGVVLNDEMDDFAIAPGTENSYRLIAGAANRVQPYKRPLSSMTPTFIEDERGVVVLGTPGGSRIISMVLLGILDYVDSPTVDLERLVSAPRYHHQYQPDRIEYEPGGLPQPVVDALRAMGHTVQEGKRRWGNMQAVYVDRASGEASAHSDPRGKGGALF
jgi:gamma-glutamyltranspeptidase / glutathione hydrolase